MSEPDQISDRCESEQSCESCEDVQSLKSAESSRGSEFRGLSTKSKPKLEIVPMTQSVAPQLSIMQISPHRDISAFADDALLQDPVSKADQQPKAEEMKIDTCSQMPKEVQPKQPFTL